MENTLPYLCPKVLSFRNAAAGSVRQLVSRITADERQIIEAG